MVHVRKSWPPRFYFLEDACTWCSLIECLNYLICWSFCHVLQMRVCFQDQIQDFVTIKIVCQVLLDCARLQISVHFFYFGGGWLMIFMWAATWQNQRSDCALSEDADQPGHPPSLISLRCALHGQLRTQAFFMRTAKTLIRLGGCPGWIRPVWSESSLGAHSFCWFCHVAAHIEENDVAIVVGSQNNVSMSCIFSVRKCLREF